jgi:hypothetical protein
MAIPPNCVALKLERELPLLVIILNSAEKTHPRKDPTGVLTAETMYTGGIEAILMKSKAEKRYDLAGTNGGERN